MQAREKVEKSWTAVFFQWFVAQEARKVGSIKRRGSEPAGLMREENFHVVVARSTRDSIKIPGPWTLAWLAP